jgi:hypothetical protein
MLHAIPRAFSVRINQASQRPKRLPGQTAYNPPQGFLSIVELAYGNRTLCLLEDCIRGVWRMLSICSRPTSFQLVVDIS